MRVVRSVIYGYLGAILGGLLVAVIGIAVGFPEESIVAACQRRSSFNLVHSEPR